MRFFREVLILGPSLCFKENITVWENINYETWKLGFSGLVALLLWYITLGRTIFTNIGFPGEYVLRSS